MDNLFTRKESFLVVLDSRNATGYNNGSMNSDLTFDLTDSIRLEPTSIQMSMIVSSFTCPVSFYNINISNCILQMTINNISTSIIFPFGNYNSTQFITYLLSVLPDPINWNISLNSQTNRLTITNTSVPWRIHNTSTIYEIMGFSKNTNYKNFTTDLPTTYVSITLPFCVNFSGLASLNIHINNIRTRNIDSLDLSVSKICASVPINASQNGYIYYEKKNDFSIIVRESTIDYFDISLKDDLGKLLDLNNQHYNLVLQFDIVSDIPRQQNGFYHALQNAYN
jgi:hypothetical protein